MSLYTRLLRGALTRSIFMTGDARAKREQGLDWPGQGDAETMIGDVRLKNIEELVTRVLKDEVPGDLVECGVWRGGACIFMAGILADQLPKYGLTPQRCVWVCDSFEGCPKGTGEHADDPHHTYDFLKVDEDQVRQNFIRYDLLADNVRFVKGFFKDTLPCVDMSQIALLRADGDLYESQMQILEALYNRVAPGGFVIIDDYYNISGSHHATNDFREERGIDAPMVKVDWCAAYWRKPGRFGRTPEETPSLL